MSQKIKNIIVDQIIDELKNGIIPWESPYFLTQKCNLITGHVYTGINRLLLSKCSDDFYVTFKQANDHGLKIKKGARGKMVVFWKFLDKETVKKDGNLTSEKIPLLRYYKVFGLSDIDSNTDTLKAKRVAKVVNNLTNEQIDSLIARTGAVIKTENDKVPHYTPLKNIDGEKIGDTISIPDINHFNNTSEYYKTLFHELGHWTGADHRCNRGLTGLKYSLDGKYGREELVAEITSSMMMKHVGLDFNLKNTVAYIQSWMEAIENDRNIIFSASTKAEEAYEYILGITK